MHNIHMSSATSLKLFYNTYIWHTYLPYSTCTVLYSLSNPSILSALHVKTSPLLASVIVIVETFPLVGSGDPLRNHWMVIGGVPLTILQSIVTSNPS